VVLPTLGIGGGKGEIRITADAVLLDANLGTTTYQDYGVTRTRMTGAMVADGYDAEIRIDATGRVDIGTSSGVPLLAARGVEQVFNRTFQSGNAPIVVKAAQTETALEPGRQEFVTLYARALGDSDATGDNAHVVVRGNGSDVLLESGAMILTRTGDFVSTTPVNPSASAPISFINDGGTVTVNGDMLSEAAAFSNTFRSVTVEGLGVNVTGTIDAANVSLRANSGDILFNGDALARFQLLNDGSGSIDFNAAGSASVSFARALSGDISLAATNHLNVASVTAGSTNRVTLSGGTGITRTFGGRITAGSLDVTTTGGVFLVTTVNNLSVNNTGSGTVDFVNDQALRITGINAGSADVDIRTTSGDLTVGGNLNAAGQLVTLDAAGAP
jgi:hypothetical protein